VSDADALKPDPPLSPEEEAAASRLSAAELKLIYERLLSHMSHRWQKVARIVGLTMMELSRDFPTLPDVFYGLRLKRLAESGAIEAAGTLSRMRYSEVRIPDSGSQD